MNLPPNILWPAGCINLNEISTLPSYPRPDSNVYGLYPTRADGHADFTPWLFPEFPLVDIVRGRAISERDRCGLYGELPQVIYNWAASVPSRDQTTRLLIDRWTHTKQGEANEC